MSIAPSSTTVPSARRRARHLLLALAVGLLALATGVLRSTPADAGPPAPEETIVLVHGAFADSSSWSPVIERLQRRGYNVIAPANPLRGLASDAAYLRDFLATVEGPIVLVGHSYGGMVMTNAAAGNDKVEALVYVAAFAPDLGDTVASLSASAPGSQLGPPTLTVRGFTTPDGTPSAEGYITPTDYWRVFAADLPKRDAWAAAVAQRPADLAILTEPSGAPAWRDIPAFTLVATQDQVIPAAAQRMMAERAGATVVEVRASHSVALSRPATVSDFIVQAARAAG